MRPIYEISVDVETDETNVQRLNLLSIGAVPVRDLSKTFYGETRVSPPSYVGTRRNISALGVALQGMPWLPGEPLRATPGTLEWCLEFYARTEKNPLPLVVAQKFSDWVDAVTPEGHQPVLMAGPAAFDIPIVLGWLNVNRVKHNLSFSGICLKTLLWAKLGRGSWDKQRTSNLPTELVKGLVNANPHNPLEDAIYQAKLYNRVVS